jgi:rhodanese-related sulfurtransferase
MELEKKGIPVATLISTAFLRLAAAEARAFGFPDYPLVAVPHPFGNRSREWVRSVAEQVVDQVVALLTGTGATK